MLSRRIFHLGNLLFHAVGPALQIGGLAGLLFLAWRHTRSDVVLLTWVLSTLLLLGSLTAKNTRYLLPLVPLLCVGTGVLIEAGRDRLVGGWRHGLTGIALATVMATAVYGIGYLRVYQHPDSRLQAAMALPVLFDMRQTVGFEDTGVRIAELVPPGSPALEPDIVGELFATDDFLLRSDQAQMLTRWITPLDGMVLVDVARHRHFAAAATDYPVIAGFYDRLLDGRFGLHVVAEFRTDPGIGPLSFDDRSGNDPSFYGFDHPHTIVLRRRIDATSAAQRWIADLRQDPDLVDSHILAAGRSLQLGDFEPARAHLVRARVVRPGHHLAQLLACEVELRTGRPHEASKLWRAWLSRLGPPGRDTLWDYDLTGMTYAGHTLIRLGAPVTGQRCLEIGRR